MERCVALLYVKSPPRGTDPQTFRVALPSPEPGEGFDRDKFVKGATEQGFIVLAVGTSAEIDKVESDLKAVVLVHTV